jgi:ABC-type ATPase with predicted acetyltransferase domain
LDFSSTREAQEYVQGINGWTVDGDLVRIQGNGDNDVKAGVVKEQVELNRECRERVSRVEIELIFWRRLLRVDKVDRRRCSMIASRGEGRDGPGRFVIYHIYADDT